MTASTRNYYPQLERNSTKTTSGSTVISYMSDLGSGVPVLTLIHGYPQSSFIWRYIVPNLLQRVSLFIPELPGYGISSPAKDNSRISIASSLLEALTTVFHVSQSNPRSILLGGHDRGARLCHRLAVTGTTTAGITLSGTILIDIVPTKVQWNMFSDPKIACSYFHWPLLANVPVALAFLKAYGGGEFVRNVALRIAGTEVGIQRILAHGAVDVYAELFNQEDTLRYSCEDYASGAAPECEEQTRDQESGAKVNVPTMIIYSEANLGSHIDVAYEWREWIKEGTPYEPVAIGEGHGHYLPEEAYGIVTERILEFLAKYFS